ncbi:MAG: BlaI/MecI/CopY family transcriptional regulator [Oscillospiraceae bacterium]|nr:BlaI/MecI/CopY family transcriptional regulator [Oscillospiraceae bacterium]
MQDIQLGAIESRFADIIWANAPLPSSRLVELALSELGWKKSTTYTVLKRLCDKGLFQNQKGTVCVCLSRQEFYARQSQRFVNEAFQGSLPAFLAAFTSGRKLTQQEADQLRQLIADHRED